MNRFSFVVLFMLMVILGKEDIRTVNAVSDNDEAPIPKLKKQFAVPAIKFLICQS